MISPCSSDVSLIFQRSLGLWHRENWCAILEGANRFLPKLRRITSFRFSPSRFV
jgi:hypothetical protein